MDPPAALHLAPRPSRCLALALTVLHAAAGLAVCLTAFDQGVRWALGAGVAASWLYGGYRHWRGTRPPHLVWTSAGHWLLEAAERPTALEVREWDAPWVAPALVVLRFRVGAWRRRRLVLCADSLDAETHRRLRVRLRGGAAAGRNCRGSESSVRAAPDR